MNPNSPATKKIIASTYPNKSPSGGRITQNSIGPDGLEIAYWPKGFPLGGYRVFVYDLIDAKPPPATQTNPVNYTIDVYLNGQPLYYPSSGTIGFLQTSGGILETIPPATTPAALAKGSATPAHTNGSATAQTSRTETHAARPAAPISREPPHTSSRTSRG